MAVKVDDTDWPVGTVDATEEWEGDGVVATQSDQTWKCLALLRPSFDMCIGLGRAGEKCVMAFLDLLQGIGIIVTIMISVFKCESSLTVAKESSSTYEVTGISPQSMTVAQLLKGLASSGTLYPPRRRLESDIKQLRGYTLTTKSNLS